MNKISILLDRHYPYSIKSLSTPKLQIKKADIPKSLPKTLGRLYHAADLYLKSFHEDVVLGNRRSALLLGLMYHVYKPKKISLIGYEIIFNFKDNLKNKLVKWIWSLAVKKIDRLVVMTESERQYLSQEFDTTLEKFKTISFYTENADFIGPNQNGYVFAAGRMERDFETLIRSLTGTSIPAVIVADKSQEEKLEKIKPSNVQILYNIPREEYKKLLAGSKIVVVPLYEGAASRGQVVILEAMKLGKPVISSRVNGTVDYLEEGKDGLFVEAGNPQALKALIKSHFDDFEKLEKMGKQAYKAQRSKYSPEIFHQNYRNLIEEEYRKKSLLPETGTEETPEIVQSKKLASS